MPKALLLIKPLSCTSDECNKQTKATNNIDRSLQKKQSDKLKDKRQTIGANRVGKQTVTQRVKYRQTSKQINNHTD